MKDKIIRMLVDEGGYREVSGPLRVVDTDFASDFNAVLVGPGEQGCLIVVVDSELIAFPVIQRRVRSFALVLDRTGSRRPLTVILIAQTPRKLESLEKMCRVVMVTPTDDVASALRGLLPLRISGHEHTLHAADNATFLPTRNQRPKSFNRELIESISLGERECGARVPAGYRRGY